MTGSLQIKNGKYYAVLRETINGKQKTKWVSTTYDVKGNKKKAEQFLQDLLSQNNMPQEAVKKPSANTSEPAQSVLKTKDRGDIQFHTYLLKWLENAKISIAPITYDGYKKIVTVHLVPYFKKNKLKLNEITREDIQTYINLKAKNGRKDKKGGLAHSSVKKLKIVMNLAFKEAIKDGIIDKNPCDYVKLPKNELKEVCFYDEKQIKTLFEAIKDEALYPLVYITVIYGLRRSEVLGLRWDSFDFERNMVTIKYSVVEYDKIYEQNNTKTSSSHRSYPLTDDVKKIILNLKEKEEANRKLLRKGYVESDRIFKWDSGEPYRPDSLTRLWSKLLKKYGLPHIRFHDLRHSCASLLIAKGWQLKDIQDWLGHADISTTANIYGHLDATRKTNIAHTMSKTFENLVL